MSYSYFCGWDVSKLSLNYCLQDQSGQVVAEGQIDNTSAAVLKLLQDLYRLPAAEAASILHCSENTGQYSHPLLKASAAGQFWLWNEDALQLNRSLGRQRDKTDAGDARLIAEYARRYADRAQRYVLPSDFDLRLSKLTKLRQHLVSALQRSRTMYGELLAFSLQEQQQEDKPHKKQEEEDKIFTRHLKDLAQRVEQVEEAIEAHLEQADQTLRRKIDIARSVVPGIGPKNSLVLFVITGLFERIPSAAQCASYAGISPHERQSGTSLRSRYRASRSASRSLKTALHQGAMSLIRGDNPFNALYRRLRAKGKGHRPAINAVRNKIIRVLYGCLKNDTIYSKNLHQNLHVL
jgi:transposase